VSTEEREIILDNGIRVLVTEDDWVMLQQEATRVGEKRGRPVSPVEIVAAIVRAVEKRAPGSLDFTRPVRLFK